MKRWFASSVLLALLVAPVAGSPREWASDAPPTQDVDARWRHPAITTEP
jgi:hypothetical protein